MENKHRLAVEYLAKSRSFYYPSFSIHGSSKGFVDYGVNGIKIKNRIIDLWKHHFVFEDDMDEIETPCITPDVVFRASGHFDRFTDLIVRDIKTGECFRADHLIKNALKILPITDVVSNNTSNPIWVYYNVDDMTPVEISSTIKILK